MEQNPAGGKAPIRITTPEELHDFLRVSSPRLWIVLTVIVGLLVCLIVFAATQKMENTMNIRVTVSSMDMPAEEGQGETAVRYTQILGTSPADVRELVNVGMEVRFSGLTGKVSMVMNDEKDSFFEIQPDAEPIQLPEGTYDGELILENKTPLSFLLN